MTEPLHALCDLFASVQGEGEQTGRAMLFIRFWGCPLACPWCDEPRHRDPACRFDWTAGRIHDRLQELGPGIPHILLTGGEPLVAPGLNDLVAFFKERDYWVALETSGVGGVPPPGLDWITLSPKTRLSEDWYRRADEIKYVLGPDPDPAAEAAIVERAARHPRVRVQPRAAGNRPDPRAVRRCLELVMAHGARLRLSLQVHKWLGVP
ncbi:MAG: 7-carboxy-7-deazaguanine synthase QueE [Magnetococcales bacterium]|nr:7-carboxy-7-deazaguanine synthase QueE [Magnetococcales bacterium]